MPELARRYREQVTERSHGLFVRYLTRWIPVEKWKLKDKRSAANAFAGLLCTGVFDETLHGLRRFSDSETAIHARIAAAQMLVRLNSRCF